MANLPHLVFNTNEVKNIEKDYARSHNNSCYDLMEKAGLCVFNCILKQKSDIKNVWIFAGKGNNGGDGYVVARLLKQKGINVSVFAIGLPHETSDAMRAYMLYKSEGGLVHTSLPQTTAQSPCVIVDALLGTGLKNAPHAPFDEWILFINKVNCLKISIDIPSGVNSDTGDVLGDCIKADFTVCMIGLKPGLLTNYAVDYVGKIIVENLNIDTQKYYKALDYIDGAPYLPILNREYVSIIEDLPYRMKSANKGDSGKVLIIGGSYGMGGAAKICGIGALRAGSGLVKVATDERNFSALNASYAELMTLDFNDLDKVSDAIKWADVIAIGPGLSQSVEARDLLYLLKDYKDYVVMDADALNILASLDENIIQKKIITPHPGEAARLLHTSVENINRDRFESAYRLWQKFGGVVLLKGPGTIVCDGKHLTIINEGSQALASGGMGDLLTGIIAAFLASGMSPNQAVVTAACVHGKAGSLAGLENGPIGVLASDLGPYIKKLVNAKY